MKEPKRTKANVITVATGNMLYFFCISFISSVWFWTFPGILQQGYKNVCLSVFVSIIRKHFCVIIVIQWQVLCSVVYLRITKRLKAIDFTNELLVFCFQKLQPMIKNYGMFYHQHIITYKAPLVKENIPVTKIQNAFSTKMRDTKHDEHG